MFLSIIIPTWRNTEAELIRCMDSIYQSHWQDFEVLLVDDGNEAAYGVMLDKLACRYPITVLHAPHGGASAARNRAVTRAQGDYILFSDADDIVTRQFWHDAEEIKENGIVFDVIYGMTSGTEVAPLKNKVHEGMYLQELSRAEQRIIYSHLLGQRRSPYITKESYLGAGPVARLVRREFAQRFSFDTTLARGEDVKWNLDMLLAKPRCCWTRHVWYYIVGNPDSVTRGCRKEMIDQHREMIRVFKNYVLADHAEDYLCCIFISLAEIAKIYYLSPRNPLSWAQKVRDFNQVAKSAPFNEILKNDVKIRGGVKPALKLALYKAGLFLYVYKLKRLLSVGLGTGKNSGKK